MIIKSPTQQFVQDNSSSHFYQVQPDGSVVPMHSATLREARKLNLYASPTTIEKDVRANPQLARWIKNEIAKAFVNNPRLPEELDQAYAERVLAIADSPGVKAADKGTRIHAAIENGGTDDIEIQPFYDAYLPWQEANIATTVGSEMKIADDKIGVAGTLDRLVEHKSYGLCVLDFKTQKVKDGKAAFYESFPRQLSFYAFAYWRKHQILPRTLSVVIDSQVPSTPHVKLYTDEEQLQAYREFLCQVWLWCSSKGKDGYWPVGKWAPSFAIL
jgi:hypothetical protein